MVMGSVWISMNIYNIAKVNKDYLFIKWTINQNTLEQEGTSSIKQVTYSVVDDTNAHDTQVTEN